MTPNKITLNNPMNLEQDATGQDMEIHEKKIMRKNYE